ncbi:MAG: CBS domain-containing protein [Cyclobacteriaceae bacterium]|nr:CBS domain-containing protein [Cyclobacteriaceae bacterium]
MVPPLKGSDKGYKALRWMEELRLNQLPVLADDQFLGFVDSDDIFDEELLDKKISDIPLIGSNCVVEENQHFYEVVKTASDCDTEMVAVVDSEGKYLGIITISDTFNAFSQSAAVQNPGGVLVMSMPQIDYSLNELSRLIESDNGKIISLNVSEDPKDAMRVIVTLKLNLQDMSRIIATLERFGYNIISVFQEKNTVENSKDRYGLLMKFLDI